jgi:hypothetical protein
MLKVKTAKKRNRQASKAHTKVPPKKTALVKKKGLKQAPAPQHNKKGKESHKRVADGSDNSSLGESSGEDPDPRPRNKFRGTKSDDEDGEEPDEKVIQLDDKGENGDIEV